VRHEPDSRRRRLEGGGVKVSAVMAVHDVPEALLVPSFESLRWQTLRAADFEVIVVDDASSDERTRLIVDRFAAENDNVRVVRHATNQGLNGARRTGAAEARGDYVVFVDGDDLLASDALEQLWLAATRADADIAVGQLVRWNPTRLGYSPLPITSLPFPDDRVERLKKTLSGERSWTMCGRAYRRAVLEDSVFDLPERLPHEDLVTSARLAFAARRVVSLEQAIYYYTVNAESITSLTGADHVDGAFYAFADWKRLASQHGLSEQLDESIQRGAIKMIGALVDRIALNADRRELGAATALIRDIGRRFTTLFPLCSNGATGPIGLLRTIESAPDPDACILAYGQDPDNVARTQRAGTSTATMPPNTIEPTNFALATKDKIVFICQVDYHLRTAAALALELRKRGHACAVIDNSRFADGGRRQLPADERLPLWRTSRYVVDQPPYETDWLATARLVVLFNDLDPAFRDALEYRRILGMPSVSVIEGINDFLRVDFDRPVALPYRRAQHVFLAGVHDRAFFADRETAVVGLPGLEMLGRKEPRFGTGKLAILNVNFTYGSLEGARDAFVRSAVRGVELAGFELLITQHPMDKADLAGLPVSRKSQYELIDEGSVFVSRFATGILEALASGKPVIYFNPHGERVEKFGDPLGAYEVATTAEELAEALGRVRVDIDNGIDFRARAQTFLAEHAALGLDDRRAVDRFADAAVAVCEDHDERQSSVSALVLERLAERTGANLLSASSLLGPFGRDHRAQLNEEELIGRYFGDRPGLMIDVGANFGNSFDIYLGKNWEVHAFEPDPNNRERLFEYWESAPGLIVNELAVSDVAGQELPFFASEESTGISSLAAFTEGHEQVATVTTTTLDEYLADRGIGHVDFLKVDIEGYDKFALDGYPWDRDLPDVVLAEFEDTKTTPLGYTVHDMARDMIERGYCLYASIWHPIVRYGISHDWQELRRYDPALSLSQTWGNLIAFRAEPDEEVLRDLAVRSVKFSPRTVIPARAAARSRSRRWYADRADQLRGRSPNFYRLLRTTRRRIRTIFNRAQRST
jgi:FkbM family methyltransferase